MYLKRPLYSKSSIPSHLKNKEHDQNQTETSLQGPHQAEGTATNIIKLSIQDHIHSKFEINGNCLTFQGCNNKISELLDDG